MLSGVETADRGVDDDEEIRFSPVTGESEISMSSHQSSSTAFEMPLFSNHFTQISYRWALTRSVRLAFLRPKGTAKSTFGWCF